MDKATKQLFKLKQHRGQKDRNLKSFILSNLKKGSFTKPPVYSHGNYRFCKELGDRGFIFGSYLTLADLTRKCTIRLYSKFFYQMIIPWHRTVLDEWHQNIIMLFENRIGIFWLKHIIVWYSDLRFVAQHFLPFTYKSNKYYYLGKLTPPFWLASNITKGLFWPVNFPVPENYLYII